MSGQFDPGGDGDLERGYQHPMHMYSLMLLQAGSSPGALGGTLLIPIVFIGLLYVVMILPQQRRQKKWQAVLSSLKTGDKVTTTGGIRGTIVALKDDYVHLRVPPDNLRIEVSRASVASVTTPEQEEKK
jgi:preprotein translocase subunit YajC